MDELQRFRINWLWPIIVGAAWALLVLDVLWVALPRLTRHHAAAAGVAGIAGWLAGWIIGRSWDDSEGYWVAFTAGLAGLAGTLFLSAALWIVRVWHDQ